MPLKTACKLALLALLAGPPAAAQQPARAAQAGPPGTFATPFPTQSFPTAGWQQPGAGGPAAAQQGAQGAPAGWAQPQPGAKGNIPPGYRSVGGTRQAPPPPAEQAGLPGGGGKVMYFHKSADALLADVPPDTGAVALAPVADRVPTAGVPDVPPSLPGIVPPPPARHAVPDRPIPVAPSIPAATAAPRLPVVPSQPAPTYPTAAQAEGQPKPMPGVPAEQKAYPGDKKPDLPNRAEVFQMRDDRVLQRRIIELVQEEIRQRNQTTKQPIQIKDDGSWQFPPLNPVVPPGTPYAIKTIQYPPSKAVYEPMFVVHRRLHFEEKNAERYGWDLGFMQPFVSTAAFYKDTLLWPNSLVSGLRTGFWDTGAGKCLPGSPTPYYLYPPGLTISGTVAEAGLITGLAFIFP